MFSISSVTMRNLLSNPVKGFVMFCRLSEYLVFEICVLETLAILFFSNVKRFVVLIWFEMASGFSCDVFVVLSMLPW